MKIAQLLDYTREILQPERFRDYCPNGLQVAGRPEIGTIVSGVTASMGLLEAAQAAGADLILVHHGYFWRGEDERIVGIKQARIKFLLQHDINLVAYHLPLDAHAEYGNNVQLAKVIGATLQGWAGEQNMLAHGQLNQAMSLDALGQHLQACLGRPPLLVGEPSKLIRRIAWCTGGAQSYMAAAIELGVDAFISGEISEQTVHQARESGVAYISAGHHATERYGVKALGEHLAQQFSLKHMFIDIDNPA